MQIDFPDATGAKQLDHGVGDTFVSSVLEEVSFASIDFQASSTDKRRTLHAGTRGSRYKSMGDTIVQLRGPPCSG
jgi:hypothetical protein